jgi:hypothetical protein
MIQIGKDTQKGRRKKAVIAGLLFAGLLALFFWNPEHIHPVSCLFHEITGHSCPTCGMTRSLCAVSHWHIREAIRFHPMGPVLYLVCLVLFGKFLFEFTARKEVRIQIKPFIIKSTLLILFILWVGLWIFRLLTEFS